MSSGCGDVLSLEDLKTAKKHQLFEAEVITGRQGGVASGAGIDYATNQNTGQSQKTLPAILRDLGFNPASFDFTTGGTLGVNDRDKVVFDPVTFTWYSWAGALPKVIPAATNPLLDSNWKPRTDPTLRDDLTQSGLTSLVFVGGLFNSLKSLNNISSRFIQSAGHTIMGVGSARYYADGTTGPASTGDEAKFYDADGKGWALETGQKLNAFMFGMVGRGDNATDETTAFGKMLTFSSAKSVEISIPKGVYGYYLLGQSFIPNNTQLTWSPDAVVKARDDLAQTNTTENPFQVLFRFQDTVGAVWKCNRAKFYFNKSLYTGEHNHIFMLDGASDIYLHDPNAEDSAGDGYYVGGRFSVARHCTNIHLIRPRSFQARRNNLSVISCDGLFVHDYDFRAAGINGANPSGPCAGIDVEPETYTDALRARFTNGLTRENLRQGTVFAMTKLPAGVLVDIQMDACKSYSDSRGFECTRVNARNDGLIRLNNPVAELSRFASFHSINSASTGILYELINPIAIDPAISSNDQNGGSAPYYINNYNDGSVEDIYPQKFGGVRIIGPAVKYITQTTKTDYCVRVKMVSSTINAVTDIQMDNIQIINPRFKKSDYLIDCFNVTIPSGLTYNAILDVRFDGKIDYRKDVGTGFNAQSYPGGVFSNYGASASVTVNLNTPVVGREFEIAVMAGFALTIQPSGSNIYPYITANSGSQRIQSSTVGNRVRLTCVDVGGVATWVTTNVIGTWTVI